MGKIIHFSFDLEYRRVGREVAIHWEKDGYLYLGSLIGWVWLYFPMI